MAAQYVAIDLHSSEYRYTAGAGIGDGQQVGIGYSLSTHTSHPLLWRGSASSVVDLYTDRWVLGASAAATNGGMQAGWGTPDDNSRHALKWTGSVSSVVDLHPSGFGFSSALGISGDQVVGFGEVPYRHALLWTSRGVVDLNPTGFANSQANATDGASQVGDGTSIAANGYHALLWTGSADSVVDLHPGGDYSGSAAYGVSGGQQVGEGTVRKLTHALLWAGSAQSVVDLHPNRFHETIALAVAAGRQVGSGTLCDGSTRHALVWNGTAESVVDLHVFLPPGFTWSGASGVDASGNIIGTAGDTHGMSHAILWVPQ